MPIDGHLLEILCCPVSKRPLGRLEGRRLNLLNQAIEAGDVRTIDDRIVEDTLEEALVTDDGKVVYAVRDGIPILLEEEGIGTTQLKEF